MVSKKIQQEIVTAKNDPRFRLFQGDIIEPEDPFLLTSEGIERYQDLLLDPDIHAALQKRVLSLTSREWRVDPSSDRARDLRDARFVRWMLEKKILFDNLCLELLEALVLGFKVGEIIWQNTTWEDEETGRKYKVVVPSDIRVRSSERFTFAVPKDKPRGANIWGYELRLLTIEHPIKGVELPDKKFIIHSIGSKTSNPFGNGLGSKLYWPHEFKKQAIVSALVFGDKFAQPTVVGKCRPEQNRTKLERFVDNISEGTSGVLPEGMEVSLLEANRSSSQNFYAWLIGWSEEQIKKTILSETFGNVSQGLSGQPAANDETARQELVKADADLLSATLNRSLIAWAVELSFGSEDPPTVWREFNKEEDLNQRINRDKTLESMGFRLTFEKVEEVYGEGYEDLDAEKNKDLEQELSEIMGASSEPEPDEPDEPESGEFEESKNDDELTPLIEKSAISAQGAIEDWLKDVRSLMDDVSDRGDLDDAGKLNEFGNRLTGLLPSLASDDLSRAIATGTVTSEMGGRYDVMEEISKE